MTTAVIKGLQTRNYSCNKMASSLRNKGQRNTGTGKVTDKSSASTDGVSLDATSHKSQRACDAEMLLIEEMRNSAKVVTDIKKQLSDHQQGICEREGRVSKVENTEARQHCVLRYLLQRDKQLTAVSDDLENRLRRNNL